MQGQSATRSNLLKNTSLGKKVDLWAVTETWVKADDTASLRKFHHQTKKFIVHPELVIDLGAGVALVYKTHSKSMQLHIIYPSS